MTFIMELPDRGHASKQVETSSLELVEKPKRKNPRPSDQEIEERQMAKKARSQQLSQNRKSSEQNSASRSEFWADLGTLTEADYYICPESGLRYVKPYRFEFRVNCKRRWIGQPLETVFTEEFGGSFPAQYWRNEVDSGRITLNNRVIDTSKYKTTEESVCETGKSKDIVPYPIILRDNDCMAHVVHRHESPVLNIPIRIVFQDSTILVVDKPPSAPIHPCGTYRRNSLLFLLFLQHGLTGLKSCHRLDSLTSGIVIFAKDSKTANTLSEHMQKCQMSKTYLARIHGDFPYEHYSCQVNLGHNSRLAKASIDPENGKFARTEFFKVAYEPETNTSIVKCMPYTGRTHQIRIHLEHLGYPIVNDPIYNGRSQQDSNNEQTQGYPIEINPQYSKHPDMASLFPDIVTQGKALECTHCPSFLPRDWQFSYAPLYLHALRYKWDERRTFQTDVPNWAAHVKDQEILYQDPPMEALRFVQDHNKVADDE
mmetsp:Transcript_4236/g.7747  ORF Transcript_4236/g.7747 Transcript_4236/m.7747 type:complete len:484 (-) Transcript_4236:500-1951(-)